MGGEEIPAATAAAVAAEVSACVNARRTTLLLLRRLWALRNKRRKPGLRQRTTKARRRVRRRSSSACLRKCKAALGHERQAVDAARNARNAAARDARARETPDREPSMKEDTSRLRSSHCQMRRDNYTLSFEAWRLPARFSCKLPVVIILWVCVFVTVSFDGCINGYVRFVECSSNENSSIRICTFIDRAGRIVSDSLYFLVSCESMYF